MGAEAPGYLSRIDSNIYVNNIYVYIYIYTCDVPVEGRFEHALGAVAWLEAEGAPGTKELTLERHERVGALDRRLCQGLGFRLKGWRA